ncbi:hypothetical protein [Desulfonema magnum]|uniref:Uncharacterized protein n=1 Tax=Desulfonema magnum TaxID=45655 RepID=A0A975BS48_9BACT|nr:hypothetical protein [Desulfonema magnum]QTA90575.1 Uncharacterized protein dnm_066350 [Desulfonema magnum]
MFKAVKTEKEKGLTKKVRKDIVSLEKRGRNIVQLQQRIVNGFPNLIREIEMADSLLDNDIQRHVTYDAEELNFTFEKLVSQAKHMEQFVKELLIIVKGKRVKRPILR